MTPHPSDNPSNKSGQARPNHSHSRNGSSGSPGPTEQRNLRDYLLMIRERWILGLAAAIALVGLMAYIQLSKPQVYQANASLLFESSNPQVVDITEVIDTSLHDASVDARLQTHVGQIKSASFFNFVAESFTGEEVEWIQTAYVEPDKSPPSVREIVHPGIDAILNRGTFILTVSARHRDPDVAALIANRYAKMYIEYTQERTSTGNQSAIRFLKEQAEELLENVDRSEELLHDYRREHNIVSLEENQNTILRRLNNIGASVVEARVERLGLESKLEHIETYLKEERDLVEIDFIVGYGSISRLHEDLDNLLAERAILADRYLVRHPQMLQNARSIQSVRRQIEENVEIAVTELRSGYQRARNHEQRLQEALAEAEKESLELEEIAVRYHVLRRQAEAARDSYARIVDRLNETKITSQLEEINIKMVDTADIPFLPVEPNLQKIILQSAFLGCFIFLGLPLGLGMLDNKLKGAWEVELLLGLPLLGEVPRISNLKNRERPHIMAQGQDHSACEAFRGIFSQIQLRSPDEIPSTILITSTVPGEGKSMVANNLATTFAIHGKRTLLVDCDFRRPSLHFYYERKNDRGVIRWLEMDRPGSEPLDPSEALGILPVDRNLHLLRAGGESRHPTAMFDQQAFKTLFERLKEDYDVIVIDTPPVGIFPDSLLLAHLAEEILYVCQFNRVNKTQIRKFIEKLELTDVSIGGLILNGIPTGRTSAYYDYYGYGQVGNKEYKAYYTRQR